MKGKNAYRKLIIRLARVLFLVSVLALWSFTARQNYKSQCQEYIDVKIDYNNNLSFIDRADVLEILNRHLDAPLPGRALSDISTGDMEQWLEANPWIARAGAFFDMHGNLHIDIVQKEPVVRVIHNNGVSYYLDKSGTLLPLSGKFTARVPVATGFPGKMLPEQERNRLLRLALYLHNREFLRAFTEQIAWTEEGYVLIPKIGDQYVVIGDTGRLNEKFRNLRAFYRHVASTQGWNRYQRIDLRFKDQIVCTKR